jgi:hypothetical protein
MIELTAPGELLTIASEGEALMLAIDIAQGLRDNAELADAIEAETRAIESLNVALARVKMLREQLSDELLNRLGDGEAVSASSGRVAFRGLVSGGKRSVNEDAIAELLDELPDDLRPRETLKMPTLRAIDDAVRAKRITRTLAEAIVNETARVPGLRWRTLESDDEGTEAG